MDYTTGWWYSNSSSGLGDACVKVYGRGYGNGSIFFHWTSKHFYIVKATPELTAKPQGRTLTWTGEPQALVTAGVTTGGTLRYSLDGTNFTQNIPTAADVGTYKVWYQVDGDTQYESLDDPSYVVTSIMKWPVYTVSFDCKNGSAVSSARVVHNHLVDRPADPAKEGFLFRGWYTADGEEYHFSNPVTADVSLHAEWAATYIDENGVQQVLEPNQYSSADTHSWGSGWYVVTGNDTVYNEHVSVLGNAKLVLADNLTLTVEKGIEVNNGCALTVYGQKKGTGRLRTTGGRYYSGANIAGIGGYYEGSSGSGFGDITVNGGIIEATGCCEAESGTLYVAAIGGGSGNITINGGTVTATGGTDSIGIGGNYANVNINGGHVTASSRGDGYGIGGGYATVNLSWTKSSDRITASSYEGTVNFGKGFVLESDPDTSANADNIGGQTLVPVTAYTVTFDSNGGSAVEAVRISHGDTLDKPTAPVREGLTFMGWYNGDALYDFSTPVTSNLTLTAHWGDMVYLDENGDTQSVNVEDVTRVTSDLTAWSDGWYRVGGNVTVSDCITVTGDVKLILCDGAKLTAENGITVEGSNSLTVYAQSTSESTMGSLIASSQSGAGIGVIGSKVCGTVNICGGNVTANGGRFEPGIDGTVNITGGTVTANGEAAGAGVGDTDNTIRITGGSVTANGGSTGVGIGGENCDITLSWTNDSDRITASSYNGTVRFENVFALSDAPTTLATVSNIDGKTLVPSEAFSVYFETDGGSEVDDQLVMKNGTVAEPEAPTREGFLFRGWLLNGAAYDFDTPVTDFIALEARWTAVATYRSLDGETVTTDPADVTEITSDLFWWGRRGSTTWFAVDGNVTIGSRVTVQGDVNLILRDGATLTAANGITVDSTASLTVYGQSTDADTMGALIADARPMDNDGYSHYTAGIGACLGGLMGSDAGEITVNGGSVTAYGSDFGAGIGGGGGYAGSVVINGGIVNATGGRGAAGIGGGASGDAGSVTINGGIVTATGSSYKSVGTAYPEGGAGIGGGQFRDGGSITINGGTVTANGGGMAADIGGGASAAGGQIVINGGNVTAGGSSSSIGIGAGNAAPSASYDRSATSVTLRWTRAGDRLYAKSYNSSYITLDREYLFRFADDEETAVTADNIGGRTIVPGEYHEIPKYTVKFHTGYLDDEDDEVYDSQTVYEGDYVSEPETPSADDYEFWYWADEDGFFFSFIDTAIRRNTDLYAVWDWIGNDGEDYYPVRIVADEGCEVTVTAKENNVSSNTGSAESDDSDGTLVNDGDVVLKGTRLIVSVKVRPGYVLERDPSGEYLVDGDISILAISRHRDASLTVTVDPAEAAAQPVVSPSDLTDLTAVPYGTVVTLTAGEALSGYEFVGWYQPNGKLLSGETNYEITMNSNLTLQARYQRTSGVVTFMANGQVQKTVTAASIEQSDLPADPSAMYGYQFSDWDKTVAQINDELAQGKNVTVTAMFVPIQNNFTVKVYNGESATPEEIHLAQSAVISRTAADVAGKQIAYWTLDGALHSYNRKASFTAANSCELRAVYTSDAVEAVGTATVRTASYNIDTRKLSFNVYLTVPENTTIVAAGLISASSTINDQYNPSTELTADNANYVKALASANGRCVPVNYTWNKTNVSIGDVWYVRARVVYQDEDGYNHEILSDRMTVTAGCDYDYTEKGTAIIRSASYNKNTQKASFNAYLTVPDNSIIVKAGLVAASAESFDPDTEILTAANADYVKSLASAEGRCVPVNYTWNKTKVSIGDTWYARAYLVYTDSNQKQHTVHSGLYSVTASEE